MLASTAGSGSIPTSAKKRSRVSHGSLGGSSINVRLAADMATVAGSSGASQNADGSMRINERTSSGCRAAM